MKRIISIIIMLAAAVAAHAQKKDAFGMKADDVNMAKNGRYMAVTMDMDLSDLKVKHDRAVVMTPSIVKGDSVVTLHSVGVYSYNRWYYYKRNGETMITGYGETSYMKRHAPEALEYEAVIPYKAWMDGSELVLALDEYGCCNKVYDSESEVLFRYDGPYRPDFLYVSPKVEAVKVRNISGTAFIDFPVNETTISPEYRNNIMELGKITAGIESVREDEDVSLLNISIKGYASPESPYENNAKLAKERTAALKAYVCQLYPFAQESISTSFEPEDWEGLRKFVEASTITNKAEILAIIDSSLDPDPKEWKLKSTYKSEYRYLLDNCYPALRHTDYVIEYSVRSYSDPAEIAVIIRTKPQNLSLNEFHVYAQSLEVGSPEFIEVFETAVRMYPEDEVANLNAANTAMGRGDMKNALRYLDKAGDSIEAVYARGVYEFIQKNYDEARPLLEKALAGGVEQAREPIEKLNSYNNL